MDIKKLTIGIVSTLFFAMFFWPLAIITFVHFIVMQFIPQKKKTENAPWNPERDK